MQTAIFHPHGVTLLNIPPHAKEGNGFVKRSHRTDDEEFYAIHLPGVTSLKTFLQSAQNWILYFNYRRPHFGKAMKGKTPMAVLKKLHPDFHPAIGAMPVIILDRVAEFIFSSHKLDQLPWTAPQRKSTILNETMAQYTLIA